LLVGPDPGLLPVRATLELELALELELELESQPAKELELRRRDRRSATFHEVPQTEPLHYEPIHKKGQPKWPY